MNYEPSISALLDGVRHGDEAAAQKIFDQYFQKLVQIASRKLGISPRRVANEEDVVVSALNSFFARARQGAFPELQDEHTLWPLLIRITERKAINQRARGLRQKRGGGKVRGESGFGVAGADGIQTPDPTPESIARLSEQASRLFALLTPPLQRIARLKLEGYTNAEIALRIEVAERTVERKLRLIRTLWMHEVE